MPFGGAAVAVDPRLQEPDRNHLRMVPTSTTTAGSGGETNLIWSIWNSQMPVVSSSTTSNDIVWSVWVQVQNAAAATGSSATITQVETTGSTLAIGVDVGAGGRTAITSAGANGIVWTNWVEAQNLSHEQVQARLQRQAEQRERQIVAEAEAAKARERAERLLRENLDEKQREELSAKGYFELDVLSNNGQRRRYRIHRKWAHSIHQIDPQSGQRLKTLCIHPRELVPVEDSMLAQKLMLEGGMEEDLLRIANHS